MVLFALAVLALIVWATFDHRENRRDIAAAEKALEERRLALDEREAEHARQHAARVSTLEAAHGARMAAIEDALTERRDGLEQHYAMLRQSLEDRMYAERAQWAEERRAMLDRIQDPYAVMQARVDAEAEQIEALDVRVDAQYGATPAGAVSWDPDLAIAGLGEPPAEFTEG